MKSGLVVAVMAAVTAAVTATLVVVLVTQPFAPEQLDAAAPATAAAVTSQQFVDDRPVSLAVTLGQPTEITIPVAGRVTALACAPGGAIESGSSPVAINGSPVLALSLGTPPWRDLAVGDKGSDVTALQAELARLGHDVSADRDRVGAATVAAFRSVAAAQGLTVDRGAPLPLASVVWLRAPSVTVGACALTDGDVVDAGATLASTPIPLVAARVSVMPSMLAAGDRAVTVDQLELPVDATGAISDPAALGAFAQTPSFLAALTAQQAGSGDGSVSGQLHLVEAVTVAILPPGAITTDDGVTGCAAATDGTPLALTVVGSQLGQSYVVFTAGATPEQISLTPPDRAACPSP